MHGLRLLGPVSDKSPSSSAHCSISIPIFNKQSLNANRVTFRCSLPLCTIREANQKAKKNFGDGDSDDESAAETKRLLNGYKISMKNSFVLLPSPAIAVRGFELEKFTMASFPIFNWPLRGGGRRNMRRRARSGIVKHLNDYCCNLCVLKTGATVNRICVAVRIFFFEKPPPLIESHVVVGL